MFDFELKSYSCAFSWNVFFSTVKVLFKWVEGLRRSVIVLVGSEGELIVDLAGMRKKYLIRADFEHKNYYCAFSWKVIFSTLKVFFNWIKGLRRSVIVLAGSERELIVDLAGLRKKYLIRCQISSSKIIVVRFHEKLFLV